MTTTTDCFTTVVDDTGRRYRIGEPPHSLTGHSRSWIVRLLWIARLLRCHQTGRKYVHLVSVNRDESPAAKELRAALETAMDYGPGSRPSVGPLFSD